MKSNEVYQYEIELTNISALVSIRINENDVIQMSWNKMVNDQQRRLSLSKTDNGDVLLSHGALPVGEYESTHASDVQECLDYINNTVIPEIQKVKDI